MTRRPMQTTTELPDDPALPALEAIRASGLSGAIPALALEGPVELHVRRYHPGSRATLEARAGDRHFAVKAYAEDQAAEAVLYEALADSGLERDAEVRVPPLLAWERDLRVLVIGWLEGPTARDLVRSGQGRRAGELAASWLQRTASLPMKLGPPLGATDVMDRVRTWVAALTASDPALGTAAVA